MIAEASSAPPRWKRALRVLLDGESLTARSAAKKYGEWNFRETIREIRARGVKLIGRPELAFPVIGSTVLLPQLVARYSLHPNSRARAGELLLSGAMGT